MQEEKLPSKTEYVVLCRTKSYTETCIQLNSGLFFVSDCDGWGDDGSKAGDKNQRSKSQLIFRQEDSPESYRKGMLVTEVMVFETWFGKTGYYVCPHCKITMDREFMPFCDRCGQKLNWEKYRKAKIVYPGQCRK